VNPLPPIRRALVSVSDKSKLDVLAQILIDCHVEVLSTGGTHAALAELGVEVVKVSEYTGAPEILGGRVKTLHPKIHGGILALPTPAHEAELRSTASPPIDLVIVNLYPFRSVIGGPAAASTTPSRTSTSAARRWSAPRPRTGSASPWSSIPTTTPRSARPCARMTACCPSRCAAASRARPSPTRPPTTPRSPATSRASTTPARPRPRASCRTALLAQRRGHGELRYGENPHQPARFYASASGAGDAPGLDRALVHQGKALSYNNLLDADAALGLVRDLARSARPPR
jgi:phosphoribosylaminoimidazolecarboxamide formyltransferase/IMP cyclohydrolase